MAIAKIKKINILSHKDYKKEVLDILYDKGFIEIIEEEKEKDQEAIVVNINNEEKDIEYKLAKVKHAVEFLAAYKEDDRNFFEKLIPEKPDVSQKKINKLLKDFDYFKISEEVESLSQKLNSSKNLLIKLNDEKLLLRPWEGLALRTALDLETKRTKISLGLVKADDLAEMRQEIDNNFKEIDIKEVNQEDNQAYLQIIYLKESEKDLQSILSKYAYKNADLTEFELNIEDRIKEIVKEYQDTENLITDIEKKLTVLAKDNLQDLEIVCDHLTWKSEQEIVQRKFEFTEKSFSLNGWIKASRVVELEKDLKNKNVIYDIKDLEIAADEDTPIIMENNKLIAPIEFVTGIYGYPNYREVDPTPFLAGFFILFFGLCLTDAGYGLALMCTTFLALKFLKVTGGFKKLLQVLFYGSIVTVIAGAITGGWFGITLDNFLDGRLAWLAKPLIAVRAIEPVKDPITMLILSIVLGYIHLLFGNSISVWWKIKNNEMKEALTGPAVWVLFLLMVGLWVISSQGIALVALSGLAKYAVILSVILIVLTQGKGDNPLMKILGGLSELYFGISGYIADILSYSRLLALGLATGVIGMVINIVGSMANELIPYVGWFFMILIIVGGHLMNLVISLVGAFIHSGRLQYVEFFKTFFAGGGREFSPFIRTSKYINLLNKK